MLDFIKYTKTKNVGKCFQVLPMKARMMILSDDFKISKEQFEGISYYQS